MVRVAEQTRRKKGGSVPQSVPVREVVNPKEGEQSREESGRLDLRRSKKRNTVELQLEATRKVLMKSVG